jgi:lysophospholipase L1-like esterase
MKKKVNWLIFFLIICLFYSEKTIAQPFIQEIQAFKKQDSLSFPPKNVILFVGSSSFTNWKDVRDYFPNHTIINRGFGGSSLADVIRYERDIIFPYQPKQIVIYCGENDIAGDSTITGKIVFARFKQLYNDIRTNIPRVPIIYISMKPSPSRWYLRDKMMEGNILIQKFLKNKKRNAVFVDVWKSMLGSNAKPMEDLFVEDMLHMNKNGYAIWQKLIEPYLKK